MEPFPDVRGLTVFPGLESQTLEFKETFSTALRSRITNTIVSFLNAKGGYIVCGVEDRQRKIVGLKVPSAELDIYLRWFDDFYHAKRIVASDKSPLTPGEVEAKIIEVREDCYILVVTVIPTPGKAYKTKEGVSFYRLAASVYKIKESLHSDMIERDCATNISISNRKVDQANKEVIAIRKAAREELKAVRMERDAAIMKQRINVKEMVHAQARAGEYKKALEEIRQDTLAIIGVAKGLEERLDLYVAAIEREILEKKAVIEEELEVQKRSWWKCW